MYVLADLMETEVAARKMLFFALTLDLITPTDPDRDAFAHKRYYLASRPVSCTASKKPEI